MGLSLVGVVVEAAPAAGQWRPAVPAWLEPPAVHATSQETGSAPAPVTPMVLSFAVPGVGQHVLGQHRQWAYFALEVAGWAAYLNRRHTAIDLRTRYRDFAWENGRIQDGERVDGPFAYYEALSKWTQSGSFDSDGSAPGVQPETDPLTYNGSVWDRATRIFFPGGTPVPETDPAYQRALAYYDENAFGSQLLWDWSGAPDAQKEFAALIHESDHRFSQATTALGLVIANHLISAADAYLSARGRGTGAALRILPGERWTGPAWWAVLSIPWSG